MQRMEDVLGAGWEKHVEGKQVRAHFHVLRQHHMHKEPVTLGSGVRPCSQLALGALTD